MTELVMIGITDVIFAVDSIPAIFAITTDPFIVLTSNVFAVLGLRSTFFLLAGMSERFHLLPYGLAGGAGVHSGQPHLKEVGMRILMTGGTGLVGQGVLVETLADPRVSRVAVLGRRALAHADARVEDIVVDSHLATVADRLAPWGACFYCAGAPPDMPITDDRYRSWLMHCWLEVGDQALMGADMDTDWAPNVGKPKNGFDVTLHTDDIDQARRWFEQLSEGGRQAMPFDATFWSPDSRPQP